MDAKEISKVLNDAGYTVKPSNIKKIEVLSTLTDVNSAHMTLFTYRVSTKVGVFVISEELVPNRFGAVAFSTEKQAKIKEVYEVEAANTDKDEEASTDDEETTSEDL